MRRNQWSEEGAFGFSTLTTLFLVPTATLPLLSLSVGRGGRVGRRQGSDGAVGQGDHRRVLRQREEVVVAQVDVIQTDSARVGALRPQVGGNHRRSSDKDVH